MNDTFLPTTHFPWSILLVEGRELAAKGLYHMLEKMTPKIKLAETGKIAQTLLIKNTYHLMLLDLELCDMDGLELAKLIRQEYRWNSMRIIALTAHKDEAQLAKIRKIRLNGLLQKPITPAVCQSLFLWLNSEESETEFFTG